MLFIKIMTGYIPSFVQALITVTPDSLTIGSRPLHAAIGRDIGTEKTTSCSSRPSFCHFRKRKGDPSPAAPLRIAAAGRGRVGAGGRRIGWVTSRHPCAHDVRAS